MLRFSGSRGSCSVTSVLRLPPYPPHPPRPPSPFPSSSLFIYLPAVGSSLASLFVPSRARRGFAVSCGRPSVIRRGDVESETRYFVVVETKECDWRVRTTRWRTESERRGKSDEVIRRRITLGSRVAPKTIHLPQS